MLLLLRWLKVHVRFICLSPLVSSRIPALCLAPAPLSTLRPSASSTLLSPLPSLSLSFFRSLALLRVSRRDVSLVRLSFKLPGQLAWPTFPWPPAFHPFPGTLVLEAAPPAGTRRSIYSSVARKEPSSAYRHSRMDAVDFHSPPTPTPIPARLRNRN